MKGIMFIFLAILGAIGLLIVYLISTYNSLIVLKNKVNEAWSGIDVQLKRRIALIPNLVETVKGYASHEKGTFEAVTNARAAMMSATTPGMAAQAEGMMAGALKSLFAVAEAYPELKANTNFLQLQTELGDTESKVAYSRQFYNANVLEFNNSIAVFPNVLVAQFLRFVPFEFFKATEEERQDVQVKF